MPIRALVAALVLPLPFAVLPALSLLLGGSGPHSDMDYALSTNPGTSREFVLSDDTSLSDFTTPGDPFAATAYTPDGRVLAASAGCGGGLTES